MEKTGNEPKVAVQAPHSKKKKAKKASAEVKKVEVVKVKATDDSGSVQPTSKEEIDSIFSKKKLASPLNSSTKGNTDSVEGPTGDSKTVKSKGRFTTKKASSVTVSISQKRKSSDSQPKPNKRTAEGYAVYKEEDLGWNKKNAGGTSLCPFDCSCCF